jgi:hypothetical protein
MASLTHSELAVRIVTEGALAAITGTVSGQLPIKPVVLNSQQARDMGLPSDGLVLYYPLGERTGVYFDSAGARMLVWFSGGDADRAPAHLDQTLRRLYRDAKQVIDADHPGDQALRLRAYDVLLGNGRMATIEVSYSKPGVSPARFSAQIVGMAIKQ